MGRISMGSVGFLLADWSIELIRYKKRKAKGDTKKLQKHQRECSAQTEDIFCISCTENSAKISALSDQIQYYEAKQDQLKKLLSSENADSETGDDITEKVAAVVREASVVREEVERLREERVALGRSVGSQLTQKDTQHSDRVRSLEILMAAKEKQLLQTANLLRQQLAAAKTETHHLQRQLAQSKEQMNSSGSLEQEVDSLRMVLGIKKDETEKLKSANNSLRLEVEKYGGLEVKLQVQVQKTEEMSAVIKMKNEQLHQHGRVLPRQVHQPLHRREQSPVAKDVRGAARAKHCKQNFRRIHKACSEEMCWKALWMKCCSRMTRW